jgi:hypothetical protein
VPGTGAQDCASVFRTIAVFAEKPLPGNKPYYSIIAVFTSTGTTAPEIAPVSQKARPVPQKIKENPLAAWFIGAGQSIQNGIGKDKGFAKKAASPMTGKDRLYNNGGGAAPFV